MKALISVEESKNGEELVNLTVEFFPNVKMDDRTHPVVKTVFTMLEALDNGSGIMSVQKSGV